MNEKKKVHITLFAVMSNGNSNDLEEKKTTTTKTNILISYFHINRINNDNHYCYNDKFNNILGISRVTYNQELGQ